MIYNLVIYIYLFGVKVAGLFSAKPAKMVKGHREVFDILRNKIDKNARYIWFHAASLGEFEQGRPLIERIRKEHPEYKILQTFFSPSGYEVRKNYQGADLVCYLPFDTPRNVRRFVELANPCMVFFIKYEFWQNYLNELHRRGIPTYSVSSIFRPNQIFFRWYGKRYSEVLRTFAHLFVQNEVSKELLATIGVTDVTVVGDTRFDRVLDICHQAKQLPLVEKFKGDSLTFVAGSSWGPDEDIFIKYFNEHPEMKLCFHQNWLAPGTFRIFGFHHECSLVRVTPEYIEFTVMVADTGCPYTVAMFRTDIGNRGQCVGYSRTYDSPVDKVFGV